MQGQEQRDDRGQTSTARARKDFPWKRIEQAFFVRSFPRNRLTAETPPPIAGSYRRYVL
jgi:hypothetical protein